MPRAFGYWLYHRRVELSRRRHGWALVDVGDGAVGPTWSYTVGFGDTTGWPELIVFSQQREVTNGLLWEARRQFRDLDFRPEDGAALQGLEGFECAWRKVHQSQMDVRHWFLLARERKQKLTRSPYGLEGWQIFVPDNAGKYPWEDGFDETWRRYQLELDRPFDALFDDGRRLAVRPGL